MPNDKFITRPHILFICGRNKWRSPTAERIYQNDERIIVRSAGLSTRSPHQLSNADLLWADLVILMEQKYNGPLTGMFREVRMPRIEFLDIPDEYQYMDPELIGEIQKGTEYLLNQHFGI